MKKHLLITSFIFTSLPCTAMENKEQQNLNSNQKTAYYGSNESTTQQKKLSSLEEALQKNLEEKKNEITKKLEQVQEKELEKSKKLTLNKIIEDHATKNGEQINGTFSTFLDQHLTDYKKEQGLKKRIDVKYFTNKYRIMSYRHGDVDLQKSFTFTNLKSELEDLYIPFLTAFWKHDHNESLEQTDLTNISDACKKMYGNYTRNIENCVYCDAICCWCCNCPLVCWTVYIKTLIEQAYERSYAQDNEQ